MPKVGGVRAILNTKVQKRVENPTPRGFRGQAINLTCEKVSTIPTLSLKSADSAHPENTRHFCSNPTPRITAQA